MSDSPAGGNAVLRRLAGASWRALPTLALVGVGAVCAWWLVAWLLGPGSPAFALAASVIAMPAIAAAIDAVQRGIFDSVAERCGRGRWRHLTFAAAGGVVVGAFGALSVVSAAVATSAASAPLQIGAVAATFAAASAPLQIGAVAATFAAASALAILAIAIPIVAARHDASVHAVLIASTVAAVRRPLLPFAVLLSSSAVAWLGLTWFSGLLVFVLPLFAVVSVAAAWSSVSPIGVALPPLTPLVRRRVVPNSGAA